MKKAMVLSLLLVPLMFFAVSCSDDDDPVAPPTVDQLIATSLHNTTDGMKYFYDEENGGFEQFTDVPYEDLGCKNCHITPENCNTCHVSDGDTPENSTCLSACHSRQAAEQGTGGTGPNADYHLKPIASGGQGMKCADCHTSQQVHGDGHSYASLLTNETNVSCQQSGCHETIPANTFHSTHGADEFECQACHAKAVNTCYNCHFESEIDLHTKIPFGRISTWKFLVRNAENDKITVGNMQTLTYHGKAFYAVAPYYAHTIYDGAGMTCGTCHSSAAVTEYRTTGKITMTQFNNDTKTLTNMQGVIPIPTDWTTALKFDFLTKDAGGAWILQSQAPDGTQMLFAEPINITNMPTL